MVVNLRTQLVAYYDRIFQLVPELDKCINVIGDYVDK
jgi:hypothetical protein